MCEILSGIYELAVTAIVIMNMLDRVFNTYCWMEYNTEIWTKYKPNNLRLILGSNAGKIYNDCQILIKDRP